MSALLVYLTGRPQLLLVVGAILVWGPLLGATGRDIAGCAGAGRGTPALWTTASGAGT